MTLVLPIAAYSPSIPSARIGEDPTVFSTWNTRNLDNKETTQISGGLNNSVLVGGESSRTSTAIDTASLLQQLAIPKPGYTSLSPDNVVVAPAVTPAGSRPGTPCILQRPGTPTISMCGTTTGPCRLGSCSSSSVPASCHNTCCNNNNSNSSSRSSSPASPLKRKLSLLTDYDDDDIDSRPKRISPFHNTPKQRRDEKRRVLRMSIQKLRQIDDPEVFLRRSVLINNMTKRMQKELREEKRYGYGYTHSYYPSTFSSYVDCPVEQDCFYNSPPAHRKRFNSCSYMDSMDCYESPSSSSSSLSSSSSHLPSSPSSLACSTTTSSSNNDTDFSPSFHHTKVSAMFDDDDSPCADLQETDQAPLEKMAEELSESLLMRSLCGDGDDDSTTDLGHVSDTTAVDLCGDQDMESCASISDSGSEGSSPPASPPSDSEMTDSTSSSTRGSSNLTELDKQILGEMDIVFNNLISVLSET